MLVVEIENTNWNEKGQAPCPAGDYVYVVKVNRKEIARGQVTQHADKHWSLLLKKIAEDAHVNEFNRIMSS